MSETPPVSSAPSARQLRQMCRTSRSVTLATIACGHKQVSDGWPVTSMVLPAFDIDGTPIILISDLADHTRHIKADDRISLLVASAPVGTGASDKIETDTARITLFGRAVPDASAPTRACYLRAHPHAAQYADFADFGFYKIAVEAAYWVGGFGKQRRIPGHQFIEQDCQKLITGHDGIVSHMNADHMDALADIVGHFSGRNPDAGWRMNTIDCDGMVLTTDAPETSDTTPLRIDFAKTIRTPTDAREILVEMCKISRG